MLSYYKMKFNWKVATSIFLVLLLLWLAYKSSQQKAYAEVFVDFNVVEGGLKIFREFEDLYWNFVPNWTWYERYLKLRNDYVRANKGLPPALPVTGFEPNYKALLDSQKGTFKYNVEAKPADNSIDFAGQSVGNVMAHVPI